MEKESKERKARCPTADHDLWSRRWAPIWNPERSNELERHELRDLPDQGRGHDPHNGYNLLKKFSYEWEIMTTDRHDYSDHRTYQTIFNDSQFLRASPTSPLELCPEKFKDRSQHLRCLCADHTATRTPLRVLISSQLLLYRLISIFGGPSKSCHELTVGFWRTYLVRKGEETSQLWLSEFRCEPNARYEGSEEGAKEDLKLLDFLVGNNVPRYSNGHLIGTGNIQHT